MNNRSTGAGLVEPPAESKSKSAASSRGAARLGERHAADGANETAGGAAVAPAPRGMLREYFESLVITAIMALFGMTFVVQAVKVPTGSMQNTILIGDHLLVNKFIFAPGAPAPFLPQREIRRGDVIVFKYPGNQFDPERDKYDETSVPFTTNFVKRVIGMPGDRIRVSGDRVYINDRPLDERRVTAVDPGQGAPEGYAGHKAPLEIVADPAARGDGAYTVYYSPETRTAAPEDEEADSRISPDFNFAVNGKTDVVPDNSYFVMGDNRENSLDSRAWGFVPRDLVVGRAMFVYWSYDQSAPSTGFFPLDFMRNTRWSRTGTLVR